MMKTPQSSVVDMTDAYTHGQYAARYGVSKCPYDKIHQPNEYALWNDGYDDEMVMIPNEFEYEFDTGSILA